ncbi:Fc.00g021890.m01.CDS01 [Cosmosporella sp. VM-42]
MKFPAFLSLATWLAFAGAAAIQEPDAKELAKRSTQTEPHFPEPKYFKESPYRAHYDARFTKEILDDHSQYKAIKILIQTYLSTLRDLKVQTWLMHGTLLGWWWGRQVMPWDLDADVQVTEADMYYLAAYHNMTMYYYKYGDMKEGRFFLLDINPHFKHRDQDDMLNFIDARWIDMDTGLFIDITAARYNPDHEAGEGMMYDKHGHEYRDTFVFPLRNTTFEGVPALIPFRYREMLASEYSEKALTNKHFHNHEFDEVEMKWVSTEEEL